MAEKDIIFLSKQFLLDQIHGKKNADETIHPWRRDWVFALLHSLRVEAYSQEIIARGSFQLGDQEILIIRIAAILHDVARLEGSQGHAERGAEIVKTWLDQSSSISKQIDDPEKILCLIKTHSDKGHPETDLACAILKDADVLDEIGAFSVIMATNWVDRGSSLFFNQLHHRLIDFELLYCDQQARKLNTSSAREILNEKKAFIQSFISQLAIELKGTESVSDLIQTYVTY